MNNNPEPTHLRDLLRARVLDVLVRPPILRLPVPPPPAPAALCMSAN